MNNIRWDRVVQRETGPAAACSTHDVRTGADPPGHGDPVAAKVWLFGTLSGFAVERPLMLCLAPAFTLRDVFSALGERLGTRFTEHVMDGRGRKYNVCRVFVDGRAADDLDARLQSDSRDANVEVILVTGIEGG